MQSGISMVRLSVRSVNPELLMSVSEDTRDPKQLVFHPQRAEEYNVPKGMQHLHANLGVRPQYHEYACGTCGSRTTGRVLCDVSRADGHHVMWCVCACEKKEPTIIIEKDGAVITQLPMCKQFHSDAAWPVELAALFDEAGTAYAAGAYTSSSTVCRKLLMSCACHEQERAGRPVEEGKTFAYYADYLAEEVLTFAKAKQALHAIREIGNEATHHVAIVSQSNAERSLKIVNYLLTSLYSFPDA